MAFNRTSSPAFVGRVQELALLREALERASEGEPATVLVAGEAGIGKTRMLREFLASLETPAHVMYGACVPLAESGLPYGPVREALRAFVRSCDPVTLEHLRTLGSAEVANIVPEFAGSDEGGATPRDSAFAQVRMFEFVLNLLEGLATERVVVLGLEDLHWADASTLALVGFLIRNLRSSSVLLAITYRSDELHRRHPLRPWLAEQTRQEGVLKLELPRFGRRELKEQFEAITGAAAAPDVIDDLMATSEGNPFLTEELADTVGRSGHAHLPGSLRELLLDRFLRLSDATQAVLRTAAVTAGAVRPWLVAQVADIPEGELYAALRDAVDHQVLVADPGNGSFGFRHALLQEAIYSEVLPGERQILHARYAEQLTTARTSRHLEDSQALPEIAYHWGAANNLQRALPATLEAAEWARSVSAFESAWASLERVLEMWNAVEGAEELVGMDRAEVLFRAGHMADFAGEPDRASALLAGALADIDEGSEPGRAALWYRNLAWCHYKAESHDAAATAIGNALHLSSTSPDSQERAEILAVAARLYMLWARFTESWTFAMEALELARAIGARRAEGLALQSIGTVLSYQGRFEEAIDALRTSLLIAEETGDLDALGSAYLNLGDTVAISGQLHEAVAISRSGYVALCREGLERAYGSFIALNEAEFCLELGEWDRVRELLGAIHGQPSNPAAEEFCVVLTALLQTRQGDLVAAAAEIEPQSRIIDRSTPQSARMFHEALAELRLWQGRFTEVRSEVERGLLAVERTDEAARLGHLLSLGLRAEADMADAARARAAMDEESDAITAAGSLLARAAGMAAGPLDPSVCKLSGVSAHSATVRAEIARAEGKDDPDLWSTAAALWDELERPYRVAYARWREAEAALRSGLPKGIASTALRAAFSIAARLGARPLREEIELLARRARVDLEVTAEGEADPAPLEPAVDPLGLTERELEVLRLLADGFTNPQIGRTLFISPKTASIHVSNILRKLDVSSRVEAAGIAHRLGLTVPEGVSRSKGSGEREA